MACFFVVKHVAGMRVFSHTTEMQAKIDQSPYSWLYRCGMLGRDVPRGYCVLLLYLLPLLAMTGAYDA